MSNFKHLILAILCAMWMDSGRAATLTVTNFDGPTSNLVAHADGRLLTRGSVWVGRFMITDDQIRDAFANHDLETLGASFSTFGNAVAVGFDGLPGLYQDTITQVIDQGDAFIGQNVYTMIADTSLLLNANELLIYRHEQIFLEDPAPLSPALLNIEADGELIIGAEAEYEGSVGQIQNQTIFLLREIPRPIPEPSALSFMTFSYLILGARRRRPKHRLETYNK